MSDLMQSSHSNLKKILRTALVGMKPADQVLLKGYLRVLLRLEVDLEWVSASHPQVDLFMINNEFRHAESIVKLLAGQRQKPVLYISRTDSHNGWIADDRLILPLKKLDTFNDWLIQSVIVLKQNAGVVTTILQHNQTIAAQPMPADVNTQMPAPLNNAPLTNASLNNAPPTASVHTQDYQNIITIIQQLQRRPTGLYQIVMHSNNHTQTLAIIQPQKGQVWLPEKNNESRSSAFSLDWQLQPYQGLAPLDSEADDLRQWLWQQAWCQALLLLPLVSDNLTYQLRYSIKPNFMIPHKTTDHPDLIKKERQALLSVMTALEFAPCDVNQLATLADISIKSTKKIIGCLLFSGSLQEDSYKQLDIRIKRLSSTLQAHAVEVSAVKPLLSVSTSATKAAMAEVADRAGTTLDSNKEEQTPMAALLVRHAHGKTPASTVSNSAISSSRMSTSERAISERSTSELSTSQLANRTANNQTDSQSNAQTIDAQQEKRGFLSRLRQTLGL
ncbi:hypothetical protein [Psychrobacter urativorans]|uniref:Uncharacterized protein n=1 Tax=Psychrobacter urativorans TaxID=45610 RepID=A0A0M3V911_9GAMM|nr:hypothetical protein [Psychrobacter urativorans]ALF60133.1 hypothetical protein AOC03_08855 [Psychrobacter urativorans]